MWTSRSTAGPAVDVAAERERVLARRAESFRQDASEPLFQSGWQAAAQSPLSERPQIDYTMETSMLGEPKPNPEEAPVIKAAAGPKLTPELRTQVKALVRRELTQDPAVSASVVRRKVEGELDIGLNHATFHGTYWRKVKAELEKENRAARCRGRRCSGCDLTRRRWGRAAERGAGFSPGTDQHGAGAERAMARTGSGARIPCAGAMLDAGRGGGACGGGVTPLA